MYPRRATAWLAGALVGVVLAGCTVPSTGDQESRPEVATGSPSAPTTGSSSATAEAAGDPASGSDEHEADVAYLRALVPAHEQVVETADLLLERPDLDPRVADLVTRTRSDHAADLERMRAWLRGWDESEVGGDEAPGMLTTVELKALRDADTTGASRLFLEGMVRRNEGVVALSEEHVTEGEDGGVRDFAGTQVAARTAESAGFRQVLTGL